MTKQDVQEYLLEHAARAPEDLLSTGKMAVGSATGWTRRGRPRQRPVPPRTQS